MAFFARTLSICALLPLALACARSPGAPAPNVGAASREAEPVESPDTDPHERQPLPHDIVMRAALPYQGLRYDDGKLLSRDDLLETLADVDLVCIGENHDNPHDHYAQLSLLQGLLRLAAYSGREVAVGFEMVQLPYQSVLDDWGAGKIDDDELLSGVEWDKRWRFDFNLYRPIFELGRRSSATLLALNARSELTRKIAREGLRGLSDEERAELPELDLDDSAHRAWFHSMMREHPAPHAGMRRMYAAQVTWDETMAATAAKWLDKRTPARQLVVIAGAGHCQHAAIPARVARRTSVRVAAVKPIIVKGDDDPCPKLAGFDYGVLLQTER